MRLGKATIYYFDPNSDNSPSSVLEELLNSRDWVCTELFDVEEVEIGGWYDEIDLNKIDLSKEVYENYFNSSNVEKLKVLDAVSKIMETSNITKVSLDEAIGLSVQFVDCNNFTEEDYNWVKNRYLAMED